MLTEILESILPPELTLLPSIMGENKVLYTDSQFFVVSRANPLDIYYSISNLDQDGNVHLARLDTKLISQVVRNLPMLIHEAGGRSIDPEGPITFQHRLKSEIVFIKLYSLHDPASYQQLIKQLPKYRDSICQNKESLTNKFMIASKLHDALGHYEFSFVSINNQKPRLQSLSYVID